MRPATRHQFLVIIGGLLTLAVVRGTAQDKAPDKPAEEKPAAARKAFIDGTGLGWRELGEQDFVNVNTDPDTWTWNGGHVKCTGKPVGVCRSQKKITNFELVAEWRHHQSKLRRHDRAWQLRRAHSGRAHFAARY